MRFVSTRVLQILHTARHHGEGLFECALVLVLISIMVTSSVTTLDKNVTIMFQTISTAISAP